MVRSERDLVLGQDHAVADLTADLAPFELQPIRQNCAGERDADRRAGGEVPRAADDLARVAFADVDLAELQAVRVRVLHGFEHTTDAEETEVAVDVGDADPLDALDLAGRDHKALGDLVDGTIDRDVLLQPAERDLHG